MQDASKKYLTSASNDGDTVDGIRRSSSQQQMQQQMQQQLEQQQQRQQQKKLQQQQEQQQKQQQQQQKQQQEQQKQQQQQQKQQQEQQQRQQQQEQQQKQQQEQQQKQQQRQQQKPQQQQPPPLDFVVRPRFGNRFYMQPSNGGQQPYQQVLLSSLFAKLNSPAAQAEALVQLGIRLTSKTRVRLDLQEYPPGSKPQQQPNQESLELHATFTMQNPVQSPLDIKASYLKDAYIEADTAFCCLLEISSPYGDANSIPVLGRGSFSYLAGGDSCAAKLATSAQREHCISGPTAGFLQRAALTLGVTLCLCELPKEEEAAVVDFYRQADRTFNYGFAPYLDYLVYCCQTSSEHRHSYLKYLCLEWNNRFSQDRMTQALTHFVDTRQPTPRFYSEVQTVMTPEELEIDRQAHHSVKGKAAKASMYLKTAGRQNPTCCPCHVM